MRVAEARLLSVTPTATRCEAGFGLALPPIARLGTAPLRFALAGLFVSASRYRFDVPSRACPRSRPIA